MESRRDFLKTAGKFAVYTPPALMIMSQANAKDIYASCGNTSCNEEQQTHGGGSNNGGWLQDLLNSL